MPDVISGCTKCGTQFGWNSDLRDAPLCPQCGYDTVYGGKRNATGTISFVDTSNVGGGIWPFNLLFKPKWKSPDPAIRGQAVSRLEQHGLLAGIAANDPDESVRQSASKRITEIEADELGRSAEPTSKGILCSAGSVAAFLGRSCWRTEALVPSFGVGCTATLFAPSIAALGKMYPGGCCAKCNQYHSFEWSVAYSFFVPGRRGKPSTQEELQTWAKRFENRIASADSRKIHHVPGLEWCFDTADSAGVITYSSHANTQWIGWSLEPLERAYDHMIRKGKLQ